MPRTGGKREGSGRKAKEKKIPFADFVVKSNEYLKICEREKKIPLLKELCVLLGIDEKTLYRYRQNSQYARVIKRIEDLTEIALLSKGINENKPVFPMFLLKSKFGYVEAQYQKQDIYHHGLESGIKLPKKKA